MCHVHSDCPLCECRREQTGADPPWTRGGGGGGGGGGRSSAGDGPPEAGGAQEEERSLGHETTRCHRGGHRIQTGQGITLILVLVLSQSVR